MTQDDEHEHWSIPADNRIKVNVDAVIFESPNCYSYAVVARGQEGEFIEALSIYKEGKVTPEVAEGIDIREALSWVKAQQFYGGVEVETDCLIMVQAIRSGVTLQSYLGRIVDECKELLSELKDKKKSSFC